MNENERSSYTEISTGVMTPPRFCVSALNALQKSMMLMLAAPSAGPTGGAGEAPPAGMWSLMICRTFFAMRA